MKKLILAAPLALALASAASAVTMSVDLAAGTKATVAVTQTVADSLVLAGEIPAGLEVAKAVTVLAEAKARADKATAEATARATKALEARADSTQKAHDAELRKLDKAECVDWAAAGATPAEKALRQEALRVRWHVAAFPSSLGPDGRAAWLVARGGPSAGGGGNSAEVASLRKEVEELRGKTETAFHATFAHIGGLQQAVTAAGAVKEDDVEAAVALMLDKMDFRFSESGFIVVEKGDETSPGPSDGARVVLKAGD